MQDKTRERNCMERIDESIEQLGDFKNGEWCILPPQGFSTSVKTALAALRTIGDIYKKKKKIEEYTKEHPKYNYKLTFSEVDELFQSYLTEGK
jgi:hypothetical protein